MTTVDSLRTRGRTAGRVALVGGFALFVLSPIVVILLGSLTSASYISFPPEGITLDWYRQVLERPAYLRGLWTSLTVALWATGLSMAIGVPAAAWLSRRGGVAGQVVSDVVLLPLALPTVLLGLAVLQWVGTIDLPRGLPTLVAGHTLLTTPFVIRLVSSSLSGVDPTLERAARDLGCGPVRAFLVVTLPLAKAGLVAGAILAFLISFGEITMSVFLTTPRQTTLPVFIYAQVAESLSPSVSALAGLMIAPVILAVIIVELVVGFSGCGSAACAERPSGRLPHQANREQSSARWSPAPLPSPHRGSRWIPAPAESGPAPRVRRTSALPKPDGLGHLRVGGVDQRGKPGQ